MGSLEEEEAAATSLTGSLEEEGAAAIHLSWARSKKKALLLCCD
jgi:hypothetical protein